MIEKIVLFNYKISVSDPEFSKAELLDLKSLLKIQIQNLDSKQLRNLGLNLVLNLQNKLDYVWDFMFLLESINMGYIGISPCIQVHFVSRITKDHLRIIIELLTLLVKEISKNRSLDFFIF